MNIDLDRLSEENPRVHKWISTKLKNLKREYEEIKEAEAPENYVLLPANDSHQVDIGVGLRRLCFSPLISTIQEELGLNLRDNEQGFIGTINHEQAIAINSGFGGFTLPLYIGIEFLRTLRDGSEGKIKVYNGNGKKINKKRLEMEFNDVAKPKSPWRAEWFEDMYSLDSKRNLQVTCSRFNSKGGLVKVTEPLGSDTLMEDRLPGINLDDFLNNPTPQRLPRKNVKKGNLYYWRPKEGRAVGFVVNVGGVYLLCSGNPSYLNADLGVRHAKILEKTR